MHALQHQSSHLGIRPSESEIESESEKADQVADALRAVRCRTWSGYARAFAKQRNHGKMQMIVNQSVSGIKGLVARDM
jgi:hypothetical protein